MIYTIFTTILDEDNNVVTEFDTRELNADEVIKILADQHNSAPAPKPEKVAVKKVLKVKKAPKVAVAKPKVALAKPKVALGEDSMTPRERTNKLRADAWMLKGQGYSASQIATELDQTEANIKYYLKKAPDQTHTKTAVSKPVVQEPAGPRAIDAIPEMLTEMDHSTLVEEFEEGDSYNLVTLNHPDFATEEVRRTKNFTDYDAYVADYNRQYNK